MNGPTDVLEVGVIKELVGELLNPLPDLVHTDGPEQGHYLLRLCLLLTHTEQTYSERGGKGDMGGGKDWLLNKTNLCIQPWWLGGRASA